MNFTDNEQTSSVSQEETLTYPTELITESSGEDFPVTEAVEIEKDIAPKPYERTILHNRKSRNKAKKYIILSIVSACVLAGIVAGFVFYHITMSSRIKGLEQKIDTLNGDKKLLIEEKGDIASEYEKKLSELSDKVAILEEEVDTLSDKADFLDSSIRVVEDDGHKTYHVYGCEYFDSDYYWAYNKNQVVNSSEYTRCPHCN